MKVRALWYFKRGCEFWHTLFTSFFCFYRKTFRTTLIETPLYKGFYHSPYAKNNDIYYFSIQSGFRSKKVAFNQMRAQPANTTCTSDKVFFTTLYRTFEGLFTSFFTKRIISPRIFEWYRPYPRPTSTLIGWNLIVFQWIHLKKRIRGYYRFFKILIIKVYARMILLV